MASTLTSVLKDNKLLRSQTTVESSFLLIFLLVNGRIRIQIRTNNYGMGPDPGRKKLTDPEHLFCVQYAGTESSWDELREDPLPDEEAKDWCMRLLLVSKSRLCPALPVPASSRGSWFSFSSRGGR
jgi:hypothetical protein